MLQTLSSLTGSQPVASPFDASVTSRWCWHTVEPRRPNRPSASSPDTSNSFCWQSFHSLFSWGSGLPLTWQRISGRRHLHSFAFSIYGEVLYILMFLCAMPYNPIASYGMTIVTHHQSKKKIIWALFWNGHFLFWWLRRCVYQMGLQPKMVHWGRRKTRMFFFKFLQRRRDIYCFCID